MSTSTGAVTWAITYTDGRVFTNLDGAPWEAPRTEVLLVAELDPDGQVGVVIHWSGPGLWSYRNGTWWPHNVEWDWINYVTTVLPHPNAPLRGGYLYNQAEWRQAKKDILKHFDVPKSGKHHNER